MLSYKEKSDTSPTRLITSDDLEDGLEICTGNRKVDTSFLHLLLKLIPFISLRHECTSSSGNKYFFYNTASTGQPQRDIRNYFTNNTNDRPTCNGISPQSSFNCDEMDDGLISSNNVTVAERAYKDIVVLTNGRRMSMADDNQECFEGPEDIDFLMRIR